MIRCFSATLHDRRRGRSTRSPSRPPISVIDRVHHTPRGHDHRAELSAYHYPHISITSPGGPHRALTRQEDGVWFFNIHGGRQRATAEDRGGDPARPGSLRTDPLRA